MLELYPCFLHNHLLFSNNMISFKKRTLHKELQNDNWMYAVRHISTEIQLREYINLWQLLRGVSLNMDEKDEILWKWTLRLFGKLSL
jgi:hypothetical protein